jgi:hypothetical protein
MLDVDSALRLFRGANGNNDRIPSPSAADFH